MSDLLKIGAFWRKTSKTGGTFYSGTFDPEKVRSALERGDNRLLLFPVKSKKSEKGPDVELFVAPNEDRGAAASSARSQPQPAPARDPDDEMPW